MNKKSIQNRKKIIELSSSVSVQNLRKWRHPLSRWLRVGLEGAGAADFRHDELHEATTDESRCHKSNSVSD
jgi:hypothetical protein